MLDDLSRVHAGAKARLQVLDDEQGVQGYGEALRLIGLSSDGPPGRESISAILQAEGGTHLTHTIDGPRDVRLELLWEPRTAAIEVTTVDGTRTLICLGPPVLADGIGRGPIGRSPVAPTAPPLRAEVRNLPAPLRLLPHRADRATPTSGPLR
jgi:hypothetical protein